MPEPLRLAFLGCGFITRVHSQHLQSLRDDIACAYASRDRRRAEEYCHRFRGSGTYVDYVAAIDDPRIDAVVIAVPPRFHLALTLKALAAGKHVLVEKPAFPSSDDFRAVIDARNRADRVVLVGENDHYKPLAITLRRLLADGAIGEMVFAHFVTIAKKPETRRRLAQRRNDGGWRRVFRRKAFTGCISPAASDRRSRASRATGRRRLARAPSSAIRARRA